MSFTKPDLIWAFDLAQSHELVAIVGGGGKSSLMFALAQSLGDGSVTTTTTRIFSAQMKHAPAVCQADTDGAHEVAGVSLRPLSDLDEMLTTYGHCLVVGKVSGEKASGVRLDLPSQLLANPLVNTVIVEADGSRMRPCKVPAEHEPVIPWGTTLVIPVAGIDALEGPLQQVAHRPELVSALTGLRLSDPVTVEALAKILVHHRGGLKEVPSSARVIVFLNKVESEAHLKAARQVARIVLHEQRIQQVVIGALRRSQPVREVVRRVTAVVLSAGESLRMGETKQLLRWGATNLLGQTLTNLLDSMVTDILVVTGHENDAVTAIATEMGVKSVANPDYASGEMLSSLKVGLNQLPNKGAAVLVVLADQPMVTAETIDQILLTYWQGRSGIIAPTYRGRRGNPVLIGGQFRAELLSLPQGAAPRVLLERHPESLSLLEVNTPTVLLDIDTPEQYRRYRPD